MDTDEFLALSRADASGARSFIVGPAVSYPWQAVRCDVIIPNQGANTKPRSECALPGHAAGRPRKWQ